MEEGMVGGLDRFGDQFDLTGICFRGPALGSGGRVMYEVMGMSSKSCKWFVENGSIGSIS